MTLSMTKTPEQNQNMKKSSRSASFAGAGNAIIFTSTEKVNPSAVMTASEGRKSGEQTGLSAEKL